MVSLVYFDSDPMNTHDVLDILSTKVQLCTPVLGGVQYVMSVAKQLCKFQMCFTESCEVVHRVARVFDILEIPR